MNILIFLYNLIVLYWSDALLVIVVSAALAYLYRRGKKDLVKDILYNLIVKAEVALGGATGDAKYSQVVANLYLQLPLILRLLFSRDVITQYIKELVIVLKEKLKNPDVTLLSYAEEAIVKASVKATEASPNANMDEIIVVQSKKIYGAEDGTEIQPVTVTDQVSTQ